MFSAAKTSGPSGYNISNSLRFRASASAYLKRTPSVSSNQQTWTWSGWVKRGTLGVSNQIFASDNSSASQARLHFTTSDTIEFLSYISAFQVQLITTQVFRDPSAWYHIVLKLDTTNATAANRCMLYINGVQVTAFSTATYPAQNYNGVVNSNLPYYLGTYYNATSGEFLDGYLAEVNFIDGQALTPSSFGSTNATTGVWQPARYSGTYGTNGFYLKFSSIALTSGSNTGLGQDFSGNGNYWNTNNISVTAGATYDAMTDSPTLTSATVANYCTWNPLSKSTTGTITPSSANLNVNLNRAVTDPWIQSTIAFPTSGKWYLEYSQTTQDTGTTPYNIVGVMDIITPSTTGVGSVSGLRAFQLWNGNKRTGTTASAYGSAAALNDIIGIAVDMDNGKIWFSKNNTWQNSGDPAAGTNAAFTDLVGTTWSIFTGILGLTSSDSWINFGQRPFTYTPPTGYSRLNTFNIPNSTVVKGNTVMDATLYTGTNANLTVTNASGFYVDALWLKVRSTSGAFNQNDSVRGPHAVLTSAGTNAESTSTSTTGVTAFNSNGFSLGTETSSVGSTNLSGQTYVAYQWLAGAGSTSSGTGTGGITSVTQSVNTTAGFSIVTYTGSGANGTVTHGLGVTPKMFIVKQRNGANGWQTYHASLTNASYILLLDSTSAQISYPTAWNSTAPTSSVISLGTSGNGNASGGTYVAYCWAEIAGFSKFGSYTGNGSADGPFVYTGFRPRYVLIKRTINAGGSWAVYDSARNTYNVVNLSLYPNLSSADDTYDVLDLTSNGFKIRTSSLGVNQSSDTFIYAAFAESPFKNSLAR